MSRKASASSICLCRQASKSRRSSVPAFCQLRRNTLWQLRARERGKRDRDEFVGRASVDRDDAAMFMAVVEREESNPWVSVDGEVESSFGKPLGSIVRTWSKYALVRPQLPGRGLF